LFNDVDDAATKTWNRCAVMRNIYEDRGQAEAENYCDNLDKTDKLQVMAMLQYIKVKGADAVLMEINNGRLGEVVH